MGPASFEGGVDAQLPLGFSIRNNAARGGVYSHQGRAFDGLELERNGQPPIVLRGQFELGASFSTAPDLRIWKIRLPWLAGGYEFGETVSGVRFYPEVPVLRFAAKPGKRNPTVADGREDALIAPAG